MVDPPRYPPIDDDLGAGRDRDAATPRWVSVAVVVAVVLVVAVIVVLHLTGTIGPSSH